MDWSSLIALLAIFTLSVWIVVAFVSKRRTESRLDNPDAEKSTLASDTASRGKPADV